MNNQDNKNDKFNLITATPLTNGNGVDKGKKTKQIIILVVMFFITIGSIIGMVFAIINAVSKK